MSPRPSFACRVLIAATCLAVLSACSPPVASKDIDASTHAGDNVRSGFYDGRLSHDGRERSFTVYIPSGYDGNRPMPLIVALHGGLGTGKIFAKQTHLARIANAEGYIVAFADGVGRAWNAGSCCGDPAEDNVDDVGFVADLVARMTERYRIDTRRVYGTGFSNGAMMVHRIACDRPHLFTAIAAVSGGPMTERCAGADTPIAALLIQGTEDPRIPFGGGTVNDSYRMPFKKVVAGLADRDACGTDRKVLYERGDTTCYARSGCERGAAVHYCVVDGGGHQWPGGKTLMHFLLGDNTDNLDASRRIVSFFDAIGSAG